MVGVVRVVGIVGWGMGMMGVVCIPGKLKCPSKHVP